MKLLRIINTLDPATGGPGQGIRNITPALNDLGVTTEVLCSDPPGAGYLNSESFTIHALGKSQGRWGYNKTLLPWLTENLNSFDVIICHGLWQYHGYAVYKAISRLKRTKVWKGQKVFIMPHGMLDPYFQKAPGRKMKAIRNIIYWHFIEKRFINSATGLLFTCQTELLLAHETFSGYHPRLELNIGYGIKNPPPFSDELKQTFIERFPALQSTPFILFISRIHPKKGIDILIDRYNKLSQADASFPMLVVAGPGLDTPFGKKILLSARENTKIMFTGMLTGALKWAAIRMSDCFILPSHQENFGISVVEALSCGRPVLISHKVNIYREIVDAGAGIASFDTPEGVDDLIMSWINLDKRKKEEMAEAARRCYLEQFEIKTSSLKFLNTIRAVNE